MFIASADHLFGPVMRVWKDGIMKKIPWTAFKLVEDDWEQVLHLKQILAVCVTFLLLKDVPIFFDRILTKFTSLCH